MNSLGRFLIAISAITIPVAGSAQSAWAADAISGSESSKTGESEATSHGNTIAAQVQLDTAHNGGGGAPPAQSVSAKWPPPLCWMQPKYSGKQYKQEQLGQGGDHPANPDLVQESTKKRDYHEGEKGAWWFLTFDVDRMRSGTLKPGAAADCRAEHTETEEWVPYQAPKPQGAISPLVLSGQAFKALKLPAPPVKLSPSPGRQKVNLPVQVKFDAPLNRHWVTAAFDAQGVDIAATTVATPTALRIDAGTSDADPQSCTYKLAKSGTGYQVDSSKSDCNIAYQRASGDGTYPLQAQVQWKVKWTATDDPDGPEQNPALPDALSTQEVPVTVKEIQTVTR